MIKTVALIAVGFLFGLFSAELAFDAMQGKYGEPSYGVLRKDVFICDIRQTECMDGENFGGLMKGTPLRLRGDGLVDVQFRISASSAQDVLDFRDKEWADKIKGQFIE